MTEIVGHGEVIWGLHSGLVSGQWPHAYLFSGPPGVGKATVAHHYAQSLLCEHTLRGEEGLSGCQRCPSCHKVDTRCHADLIWVEMVEKKTRISVDQIRDLTRFLSLTPMESKWKVAIVDDAAEMNAAAANALLKTLEEPPAESILILITSRPGMLLATIRSRCVKYHFRSLSRDEFGRILQSRTELPEGRLDPLWEYAEGNVGYGLQFITSNQLEVCDQLVQDLEALMRQFSLAKLCQTADFWSKEDHFLLVRWIIGQWIAKRVRRSVLSGEGAEVVRRWLVLESLAKDFFARAEAYNINKRLLLEGIFIKLSQTAGANP
ncbi:MAG: DNA polymerase III subunit delta' [Magnetococcales bacterium]|nr:DNA polymerase III subunit delta' [Magnetococcales bacterium]